MATLKQLDANNFDQVINNSDVPVLVDFYADWCGPCKALAPTLEAVAEESEGALSVMKVDIDDNPELATRYKIQSIPQLIVFNGGEVVAEIRGLVSKTELEQQLQPVLADSAATR